MIGTLIARYLNIWFHVHSIDFMFRCNTELILSHVPGDCHAKKVCQTRESRLWRGVCSGDVTSAEAVEPRIVTDFSERKATTVAQRTFPLSFREDVGSKLRAIVLSAIPRSGNPSRKIVDVFTAPNHNLGSDWNKDERNMQHYYITSRHRKSEQKYCTGFNWTEVRCFIVLFTLFCTMLSSILLISTYFHRTSKSVNQFIWRIKRTHLKLNDQNI